MRPPQRWRADSRPLRHASGISAKCRSALTFSSRPSFCPCRFEPLHSVYSVFCVSSLRSARMGSRVLAALEARVPSGAAHSHALEALDVAAADHATRQFGFRPMRAIVGIILTRHTG